MGTREIEALRSNDSSKQELVIAIIEGFNKLPKASQKALKETFIDFIQGE